MNYMKTITALPIWLMVFARRADGLCQVIRGVAQMDESGGLLNLRPQVQALPPRLYYGWIAQLPERLPEEQEVTVLFRLQPSG